MPTWQLAGRSRAEPPGLRAPFARRSVDLSGAQRRRSRNCSTACCSARSARPSGRGPRAGRLARAVGQSAGPAGIARRRRTSARAPGSGAGAGPAGFGRAAQVAMRASNLPVDRFLEHALYLTARDLQPAWLPAFERGEIDFAGDARQLAFAFEAAGSREVVAPLVKLIRSGQLPPGAGPARWRCWPPSAVRRSCGWCWTRPWPMRPVRPLAANCWAPWLGPLRERKVKPEGDLAGLEKLLSVARRGGSPGGDRNGRRLADGIALAAAGRRGRRAGSSPDERCAALAAAGGTRQPGGERPAAQAGRARESGGAPCRQPPALAAIDPAAAGAGGRAAFARRTSAARHRRWTPDRSRRRCIERNGGPER